MTDHDESLIDKVKGALGMGKRKDAGESSEGEPRHREMNQSKGSTEGSTEARDGGGIGVDGATQASGTTGATGGTGSTAALGGAGSGGAVGATPEPSAEATGEPAPGGNVRTEYEMGHEVDPDHETRAESGTSRGATFGESPGRGNERAPNDEVDRLERGR